MKKVGEFRWEEKKENSNQKSKQKLEGEKGEIREESWRIDKGKSCRREGKRSERVMRKEGKWRRGGKRVDLGGRGARESERVWKKGEERKKNMEKAQFHGL
jgi:hypothetical protein